MQARESPLPGLYWVEAEFEQSFKRARALIEQAIENPGERAGLHQAAVELHQVAGTATMVQSHAVATLAGEMHRALSDLAEDRLADRESAQAAVLGALVQIADYVDGLSAGSPDSVLILQPAINELRVVRGQAVFTEAELFAGHLATLDLAAVPPPSEARRAGAAQSAAKKYLPAYQHALLNWLRGQDAPTALSRLGKISEHIAAATVNVHLYQLWRAIAAAIEALLTRGLNDSLELKRLIGRTGAPIKVLAEEGETTAASAAGELLYLLLFHIGRSRGQGPRVSALRKVYELERWLPAPATIENLRARLRGTNSSLLAQLSGEIRRDLNEIKDRLDLAVRAAAKGEQGPDLAPAAAQAERIAGTLSMLGLKALQRVMHNQAQRLTQLQPHSGDKPWLDVATALLRVEHSLDDALFRQLRQDTGMSVPELEMHTPHGRNLREGVAALLRESLINLATLKTLADAYLRGDDQASLAEAARLLGEVESALQVLGNERAAAAIARLRACVAHPAFTRLRESRTEADRFADAIASIEVFLEAAQKREPGLERRVEELETYVTRLRFDGAVPVASAPLPAPVPTPAPVQADIDPEIRDIFLAEAGEVLAQLQHSLPRVERDPDNRDALGELRRAFHTLKGSGRMVGAVQMGDFGWAMESVLNRCLEGALTLSPAVLDTVRESVALLPVLIETFRNGSDAPAEMRALIAKVESLVKVVPEIPTDLEVVSVFQEDARERLALIRDWLQAQDRVAPDFAVDQDVMRSLHTLRGSAGLVKAHAVGAIAGAFEQYFDALRSGGLRMPPAALNLLEEVVAELQSWSDEGPQATPRDPQGWLERISALQTALPDAAVEAAQGRQLAELFANEAFGQLEQIEAALAVWRGQPDSAYHARNTQDLFQKLNAAASSQCPPLAMVAQAFEGRLTEFASGKARPQSAFFDGIATILEGLYQQLDAFREGTLRDDGTFLAARVFRLEAVGPTPSAEDEPIEIPPVREEPEAAPTEVIELDAPLPEGRFNPDSDPELRAIFANEAEELLEGFDRTLDAWERNPEQPGTADELVRALHTFKGSALMAGLPGLARLAQQLKDLIGKARPDPLQLGRLHRAADGLHALIHDVQRGGEPSGDELLAELFPAPARSAPVPAPTRPAVTEPLLDAELSQVFATEAAELIETLERQLDAWQTDPSREEPLREIQRALHTLKGGARMAGLTVMGDLAHNMETQTEARVAAPDAAEFSGLRAQLMQLQRMQDALARGDVSSVNKIGALPPPSVAEALPQTYELPPPVAPVTIPGEGWNPQLFWKPEDDSVAAALRRETARVAVESLDGLLNQAGEISIYRSRLEQHNGVLRQQLSEMQLTLARLREQLRSLESETDAQIAARGLQRSESSDRYAGDFDPLEMDRYSHMQELTRSLSESINDLASLHGLLETGAGEADGLLLQQGRLNTQVQQGLMSTLMVPFSRQVARLQRVVAQTAEETGKQATITFHGIEAELDRKVLERMTAPLEHLLRNAVVHGIEPPAQRDAAGKPTAGAITLTLRREGTQLAIEVDDDGRGLNYDAIRAKAIEHGRMHEGESLSDDAVAMFIFEPGFTTAPTLTQSAGRGVGMDVVMAEVKQLGGALELASTAGQGARFLIRLPLSLAASQALLVAAGAEIYAVPLVSIEGIARVTRASLADYERDDGARLNYGGTEYRVQRLSALVHAAPHEDPDPLKTLPAILVRLPEGLGGGERRLAVVVDRLYGNREVVSKSAGPVLSSVAGITGATILPDGRVVLILDIVALAQTFLGQRRASVASSTPAVAAAAADRRPLIMVVDDSITIRRVTERLLDRNGYRVITAKDGLDAIAQLQTESPVAILLDIEMPRADGFEVAGFVRNNARVAATPILMITSRAGEKHRARAQQLGVNRYLTKPYQEELLLSELRDVLRGVA